MWITEQPAAIGCRLIVARSASIATIGALLVTAETMIPPPSRSKLASGLAAKSNRPLLFVKLAKRRTVASHRTWSWYPWYGQGSGVTQSYGAPREFALSC